MPYSILGIGQCFVNRGRVIEIKTEGGKEMKHVLSIELAWARTQVMEVCVLSGMNQIQTTWL